ncbi:multidrug transporter MatE [Christensenellaceae bacterium]|nr:multidrug transporter MatE [Christensenellaceae bacterium]BDF62186.1 multidrug transporter MatE [Christensenellaceae bacterium]
MEALSETKLLGSAPIPRLIMKYTVPSVISLLVNSLYNIVDQIFIGQGVGYLGNAATNVIFPITVIALAFALLVGDGAAAYLSLKLGQNQKQQAQKGVGNALTLMILFGVAFLLIGFFCLEPLVRMFGATENSMPYALDYGRIIVLGLPFVVIGTGLNSCIRAEGSPKVAMLSMIAGAVVNTVLDPIFIFVFHWGVEGAAWATILGQILTLLVSITYLPKMKTIRIKRMDMKLALKTAKTVMGYGISSFITQIAITISILVANNMLVQYGLTSVYGPDIPLAAFGIVMKVNQILLSFMIGFGLGAQPIVGFNYGAKHGKRVRQAYRIAVTCATLVAVVGFILFQFFPQGIINLFGSEEGLYNEFAQKSFRIFLMLCLLNGFQMVTGIFFQALGKPVKAALITLSRQLLLLVPAMLVLPHFLGVEGVLWAGPVADATAFLIALALAAKEMKHLRALAPPQPQLCAERA